MLLSAKFRGISGPGKLGAPWPSTALAKLSGIAPQTATAHARRTPQPQSVGARRGLVRDGVEEGGDEDEGAAGEPEEGRLEERRG